MWSSRYLASVAAVVALSSAAHADVLYVDDDNCPGPGSGTEGDPYCSIQYAIDNALDTDEIVVAPGTYLENINFLGKAVTLRSSDGPDVTTIDGQAAGSVVTCDSYEGPDTVLDGFTITNGHAYGGGGMYSEVSSPTVTNCTFSGNSSDMFGGGMWIEDSSNPTLTYCTFVGNVSGWFGGAMYIWDSSPTVTNCTFSENVAVDGAGMACDFSSPIVADCVFSANSAGNNGGGIWTDPYDPAVTSCIFSGNTAGNDGGAMWNSNGDPSVISCSFAENAATEDGGAVYMYSGSPTVSDCTFSGNWAGRLGGGIVAFDDFATVIDCTFIGNDASFGGGMATSSSFTTVSDCTFEANMVGGFPTGGLGGGMYNVTGSPTVMGCTFYGNSVESNGYGAGMYNLGADPVVIGCTFSANTADRGGAMYNSRHLYGGPCSPQVSNSLFIDNEAEYGGAMYNWFNSTPTVVNCTFAANASAYGRALAFDSDGQADPSDLTMANCVIWNGGDEVWNNDGSAITISYTDVQGGWPGPGNTDLDPLFVDPDNGDFRLSAASACIDAGDNTAVPVDVTEDLDGNPRFLEIPETPDTGNGDLPIVDMGAYESLGGGCLAITSQEVVCHGDGTTFTVNAEGLDACTGGTTMVTFTGVGGAVGEDFCATLLVNTEGGGFCCSTELCVPVPDCSPAALPCGLDHDGVVGVSDFLVLLGAWGSCADCGDCVADLDGDCTVGVTDVLILLANWGPC